MALTERLQQLQEAESSEQNAQSSDWLLAGGAASSVDSAPRLLLLARALLLLIVECGCVHRRLPDQSIELGSLGAHVHLLTSYAVLPLSPLLLPHFAIV